MLLQRAMFVWLIRLLLTLRAVSETRASREAEMVVLRQQLPVLSRKSRKRVRLRNIGRLDFGLAISPVPGGVGCHRHRQAGNPAPLAPSRVPRILAVEVLAA